MLFLGEDKLPYVCHHSCLFELNLNLVTDSVFKQDNLSQGLARSK
jgi:hypothetical protein